MKRFKQIDTWLSIAIMLICAIVVAVRGGEAEGFMISYCIIGTWQVISMLVHAFNHWFMKKKGARSNYHRVTLGIFITAIIGMAVPPVLLILLLILLFISPVLAIIYTCICFDELKELKLSHSLNLR